MKRDLLKKVSAVFLCVCLIAGFSLSTGCSKHNSTRVAEIINDTNWFSSNELKYECFSGMDSINPVLLSSNYKMYHKTYDFLTESECNVLSVFEGDNKSPIDINLNNYFPSEDMEIAVQCGFVFNEKCYVAVLVTDKGISQNKIFEIDTEKATLISGFDIDFDGDYKGTESIRKVIAKNKRFYIEFVYTNDGDSKYGYKVINPDGKPVGEVLFESEVTKWTVDSAGEIICLFDDQDVKRAVKLDVDTGTKTDLNLPPELLDKYWYGEMMENGSIYIMLPASTTIWKYDFSSGEESSVIDLNYCDANISSLLDYSLINCSDEDFIFLKTTFYAGEEELDNVIVELKKEKNNPHIGKTILIVAPSYGINYLQGEGIKKYNEGDNQYYFYVCMDYCFDSVERPENIKTMEEYRAFEYQNEITRLDKVMNDIDQGTGPDILLDWGQHPILDTEEYLIDISYIVNDSNLINRDDYFSNIFDAFTYNDSLYQIPLSVSVSGIYSISENIGTNQAGFTYEEYGNSISNLWEGADPIANDLGREMYFRIVLDYLYDDIHDKNGLVNLDNDSFRLSCKYAQSIPETRLNSACKNARYVTFENIGYDIESMALKKEGYDLYGFPSVSSTGPMAIINESVAITTCTASVEGSTELVNLLLSPEIQSTNKRYNPINIEAFKLYAENGLRYGNGSIENQYGYKDYYDKSIVDEYIRLIKKTEVGGLSDSITKSIINEEIQAFFAEQKSVDEIIEIIEKRSNTMLKERR